MQDQLIAINLKHFNNHFQNEPDAVYLAPGRINIIGEHIDYNDGYVLPAAIDKYVCFSIRKNNNMAIEILALDMDDSYTLNIDDELIPINKMWMNYLLGVLSELKKRNISLPSFQLAFSSTIPMGAGLSSSAALECGFAFALNDLFDMKLSKKDIALIGQQSEHNFAGVKCGIMDQFASVFGQKDKVIKLDCNTLDYEYYDADLGVYGLLLFDTCVKHTHLTSGYNDRRNEVEEGIRIIKQHFPEVKNFRDCTANMVEQIKNELGETIYKRCHFVVAEISRVAIAANALSDKAYELLGKTMTATHKGLSEEYEVSCAESDFIVETVLNESYVAGARMMGGGFGGCCLILLKNDSKELLIQLMSEKYKSTFGIDVKYYDVKIGDGIRRI
jgi:galactokinase